MNNIIAYAMLILLSVVFSACSSSTLVMLGEAHPQKESLSVSESAIVFYRGDGNEDLVAKMMVNDRVVGSLLPNRFAQTRACKGMADISIIGVDKGTQTLHQEVQVNIPGSENMYFKVSEAGDGRFALTQVNEAMAEHDLASIKSVSHIINRNVPDCTPPVPPPPPPSVPKVVMVEKPVPVVLQRINLSADALFKFNRSQLNDMLPKGRASIDSLVKEIQTSDLKIEKLRIAGHTDRIGGEAYNLKLSLQRAQTVADYMRTHGLSIPMEVVGYGEAEPITTWCVGTKATTQLIECLQPDRRVSVDLMGQKTVTE